MYCSQCGKEMPEDIRFCPYCGNAVKRTQGNKTADSTNFDRLLRENVSSFLRSLTSNDRVTLVTECLQYQELLHGSPADSISRHYESLLLLVQRLEIKTGIRILRPSSQHNFLAIAELSGIVYSAYQQELERRKPVKNTIYFSSTEEANNWLSAQNNILVTHFQVETGSAIGLFANHAFVKQVQIEYNQYLDPTGYVYGMTEEEKTNLFLRQGSSDTFKTDWESQNPGCECVSYVSSSNARADSWGIMVGFSLDLVEHVSYFILFRKKAALDEENNNPTDSSNPNDNSRSTNTLILELICIVLSVVAIGLLFAVLEKTVRHYYLFFPLHLSAITLIMYLLVRAFRCIMRIFPET